MRSPRLIALCLIIVLSFMSHSALLGEAGGSVEVTVRDRQGNVTPSALVLLLTEDYADVASSRTDLNGVASFRDLAPGTYVLEVYHEGSDSKQPEFWGALTLKTSDQSEVRVLFNTHTPRIDLFDISSQSVGPEDSLQVTVGVTNPEPFPLMVTVLLVLDRDKYAPYDVEMSKAGEVDEGSSKVFTFELMPQGPGSHYVRVWVLAQYGGETITDQVAWTEAFTASGEIQVRVEDDLGKAVEDALLVLFNEEYVARNEVYRTKRDGTVSWNPLFPVYVVEVYYTPPRSLGFVEFWHAQQLRIAEGPGFVLSKSSPSLLAAALDQAVKVGESVSLEAEVLNPSSVQRETMVTIILDRDRALPFDHVAISSTRAVLAETSEEYLLDVTPEEPGQYELYVVIQAEYNGKFVVTDQETWQQALHVTQ